MVDVAGRNNILVRERHSSLARFCHFLGVGHPRKISVEGSLVRLRSVVTRGGKVR